ncbi:hypothetical protein AB3X91_09155 [Paraburkholderia sp. BR14263]|uniref:hypothetical protein n=1 Tax=unclassified Paraburkholderia TaxID=2615204 RepID=UPI0034CD6CC5
MSIKQKVMLYFGLVVLLIFVLLLWAFFAFNGKTEIQPLISQLGLLVTIITASLAALGGYHSAQGGQNLASLSAGMALIDPDADPAPYQPPVAGQMAVSVAVPQAAQPAPQVAVANAAAQPAAGAVVSPTIQ